MRFKTGELLALAALAKQRRALAEYSRFCCKSRLVISLPYPELWRVAFYLGL
jgi:hypothetical protein